MKAIFDKETHYYKYVDTEWTQPTLTGDNVYINNFLVTGSYAAYYPNTGYAGIYVDEGQGWITLYMQFNKPFVAKKFTFHTQTGWGAASGAYAITYSYSDDNQNWFTLGTSPDTPEGQTATIDMSSNNTPHQFYRLSVRNGGWAYEDALNIDNLHLYGNIREIAEGSADDYDYKIEVGKTSIVKENDTYKAIKSYTKGQYYGGNN